MLILIWYTYRISVNSFFFEFGNCRKFAVETIQGRKLFKGRNYSRRYSISYFEGHFEYSVQARAVQRYVHTQSLILSY